MLFLSKEYFHIFAKNGCGSQAKGDQICNFKVVKFKIEVDHLVPKISVIHIPGNYIRQGCTVPKN